MTQTTLSRLLLSGSSAALIAGFATETIVVSTRIMKNPITIAHSAGQGLRVVIHKTLCHGRRL